ncbi:hypothetical protein Tco_1027552, partial [Tanacetum coccineum]
ACGSCGPSFSSSDVSRTENVVKENMELEFQRNQGFTAVLAVLVTGASQSKQHSKSESDSYYLSD